MKTLMVTGLLVLVSIFSFSQNYSSIFTTQKPPDIVSNDGQPMEMGLKFRSSVAGVIAGVKFYKTTGNAGIHTGELYSRSGKRLASAVFTNETVNGWQTVLFSKPVVIQANTTYIAAYHSALGNYIEVNNYFTKAVTNGVLTALADGTDGGNAPYLYTNSPGFPNQLYMKANYFIDVLFSAGSQPAQSNQPPVVNAGADKVFTLPVATIVLSGTASDPGGKITSLAWTQISGPNTPSLSGIKTANLAITGLIAGAYVYRLTATDNKGASAYAEVKVTVKAVAVPVVANAGSNQTITLPNSSVTLSAGGSTGTINSYAWTVVSGPAAASFSSPSSATTTVTGLVQGTYLFKLSLNAGASTSQVTVTVHAAPVTVTANAGSNQAITLPTSSVTLNGSASAGSISSYAWTLVSGPNTPVITSAGSVTTTVTGLIKGTYVFKLSVNGGASTSQVTITVNAAGILSAGADQFLASGTTQTTLTGTVSSSGVVTQATVSNAVNLIIMQGESNIGGFANNSDLSAAELQPRSQVQILNNNTLVFEPLKMGINNELDQFISPNPQLYHGFESGLANLVDAGKLNGPVYLVKIGAAGSYISQWLPGSTTRDPDLWNYFKHYIDQAIQLLTAAGKKYRITVWQSLGLNDRYGPHSTPSEFMSGMAAYRALFRSTYGADIQFLSTNFNNPPAQTYDWSDYFLQMAATDPRFHSIPVTGATYIDGSVHFDTKGDAIVAANMVDSMNKIYSTGSGSIGAGADVFTWTQVSGPAGVTIVSPNAISTSITGLVAGTYTFQLQDVQGANTYRDTVVITVNAAGISGGGTGTVSGVSTAFTPIPSTTDFIRPGAGASYWNNTLWNDNYAPTIPSGNTDGLNAYYRFNWSDIEGATQGSYNWSVFDTQINNAIASGKMFSFGIMSLCTACGTSGMYPAYLHNLMQGETTNSQDWQSAGSWIPNWNSENYLSRWEALLNAVAGHIQTGSYSGKNYRDVIFSIDVRGYGDFGEWHTYPWTGTEPAGRLATEASLERIVNAHKTAFPNYPLVIPFGAFDTQHASKLPAQFGYYVLTTKNNWGEIGWRTDNYGDDGYSDWLVNNPASYNGVAFPTLIMNKWKNAIISGEPANDATAISRCGSPHCDLLNEIQTRHTNDFGNGNYPVSATNTTLQANIRAANKAAGARILIDSLTMNSTLVIGSTSSATLYWKNTGVAPVYEDWNIVYQLCDASNAVKFSQNSGFNLKFFYTATGNSAYTDNLAIPAGLATGTYSLVLIIQDPKGYKQAYPLGITGRATDGSYTLRKVIVTATAQTQRIVDSSTGVRTDAVADRSVTGHLSNALLQNYPNPVPGSQSTIINYSITAGAQVELALYNALGIRVKVLVNETKDAGAYMYTLDTKGLHKGTYFYKIRAGNYSAVKTLLVQ